MLNEWDQPVGTPRRPWRKWLLLAALLAMFVAGATSSVYAVQRYAWLRSRLGLVPVAMLPTPVQVIARPTPVPPPAVAAQTAATVQRLQRLEQGLAQVEARATESSSNAERAEGLLVAFAARRALDRGSALGYIEGLLRDRFGGTQPQAVATILAAAHQPVTLEELQAGLDEAAPALVAADARENWWQGVRRELAGLIVLRRASVPSTAPGDRLERARRQLQAGHVGLALAEVARMPGRERAGDWITKARRYAAARGALDAIETAALLTPRARPDATIATRAPASDGV